MLKVKNMVSLFLAISLVGISSTACSNKAGNTSSKNNTDTSQPSGNAAAGKEVKLKMVYWADSEQQRLTKVATEKFMKQNPNIKIDLQVKAADLSFGSMITTMAASNTLPDISYMGETDILMYDKQGLLLDVDDLYKSGKIPPKIESGVVKNSSGKIIGSGLAHQVVALYYNKRIFDKAGIAYPPTTLDKAWTWDQFVDTAKKLTSDTKGKHPYETGFDANGIKTFGAYFPSLFQFYYMWAPYSNGGGMISADGKQFLWDKPETIQAVKNIADLMNVHHVMPTVGMSQSNPVGGIDQAFISDRVAMYISGTWDIANAVKAKKEAGVEFGMGVLPKMGGKAVTMNTAAQLVIYKATKYPEEAKKFYSFYLNPEETVDIIKAGARLPNELKWYTDTKLFDSWTSGDVFPQSAKEVISQYNTIPGAIVQWPALYTPSWIDMTKISEPALDQVWSGKKTAEEVLTEINKQIKPIFEKGNLAK